MEEFDAFGDEYLFDEERTFRHFPESSLEVEHDRPGDFRELSAWQEAMDLAIRIYGLAESTPDDDGQFGLIAEMRRCAVSVPSTIARGRGRGTAPDLVSSLDEARGSLAELRTHIVLGNQLGLFTEMESKPAVEHVQRVKEQIAALKNSTLAQLN